MKRVFEAFPEDTLRIFFGLDTTGQTVVVEEIEFDLPERAV
ncbi:hypothetical protein BJ973_009542 [Actinoplanes tereljensis]|nr:hypothetical protein [Actinoplanes tereljensis]